MPLRARCPHTVDTRLLLPLRNKAEEAARVPGPAGATLLTTQTFHFYPKNRACPALVAPGQVAPWRGAASTEEGAGEPLERRWLRPRCPGLTQEAAAEM